MLICNVTIALSAKIFYMPPDNLRSMLAFLFCMNYLSRNTKLCCDFILFFYCSQFA